MATRPEYFDQQLMRAKLDLGVYRRARSLVPGSPPTSDTVERAALIHREIFQLGVLILVAIAAFLLTRAVAASNRDMSLRDAAEWYRRGQQAIDGGQDRRRDRLAFAAPPSETATTSATCSRSLGRWRSSETTTRRAACC